MHGAGAPEGTLNGNFRKEAAGASRYINELARLALGLREE
jgi:hypothetical protein